MALVKFCGGDGRKEHDNAVLLEVAEVVLRRGMGGGTLAGGGIGAIAIAGHVAWRGRVGKQRAGRRVHLRQALLGAGPLLERVLAAGVQNHDVHRIRRRGDALDETHVGHSSITLVMHDNVVACRPVRVAVNAQLEVAVRSALVDHRPRDGTRAGRGRPPACR